MNEMDEILPRYLICYYPNSSNQNMSLSGP
jgi:hypothetical protein